jgi:hypothetical protein
MSIPTNSFAVPYTGFAQSTDAAFSSVRTNLLLSPGIEANTVQAFNSVTTNTFFANNVNTTNVTATGNVTASGTTTSAKVTVNGAGGNALEVTTGGTQVQALSANSAQVTTELGAQLVTADEIEADVELRASNALQLPVDKPNPVGGVKGGLLQYDTTRGVQVYDGTQWVNVGSASVVPETRATLIPGSGQPVDYLAVDAAFIGDVYNVADEAQFAAALAAATDDDIIRLTASFNLNNQYTITRELKFDLNALELGVHWQNNTYTFRIEAPNKDVVFEGGAIIRHSGSASGSSTTLFAFNGPDNRLFFNGVLIEYGELCVTMTNGSVYAQSSIFRYRGAHGQSASNSYRTVLCSGASTAAHYVYFEDCKFDSVAASGSENLRVVFYNTGGLVSVTGGSCTFTDCQIQTAHRVQALAFYEACCGGLTRGTHKLHIDNCVLDNTGARNQLALVLQTTQYGSLNSFERISLKHNTFQRHDDDKGLLYFDMTGTYPAGSTDVFMFANVHPALTAPGPTRQLVSTDGLIRGSTALYGIHLQKHV